MGIKSFSQRKFTFHSRIHSTPGKFSCESLTCTYCLPSAVSQSYTSVLFTLPPRPFRCADFSIVDTCLWFNLAITSSMKNQSRCLPASHQPPSTLILLKNAVCFHHVNAIIGLFVLRLYQTSAVYYVNYVATFSVLPISVYHIYFTTSCENRDVSGWFVSPHARTHFLPSSYHPRLPGRRTWGPIHLGDVLHLIPTANFPKLQFAQSSRTFLPPRPPNIPCRHQSPSKLSVSELCFPCLLTDF